MVFVYLVILLYAYPCLATKKYNQLPQSQETHDDYRYTIKHQLEIYFGLGTNPSGFTKMFSWAFFCKKHREYCPAQESRIITFIEHTIPTLEKELCQHSIKNYQQDIPNAYHLHVRTLDAINQFITAEAERAFEQIMKHYPSLQEKITFYSEAYHIDHGCKDIPRTTKELLINLEEHIMQDLHEALKLNNKEYSLIT